MHGLVLVAGRVRVGRAVCPSVREATAGETTMGVKILRVDCQVMTRASESPEGHSTTVVPFLTGQSPLGLTKTTTKTL